MTTVFDYVVTYVSVVSNSVLQIVMELLLFKAEVYNLKSASAEKFMKTSYLSVFCLLIYADRYPENRRNANSASLMRITYWRNAPENLKLMGSITTGCALVFLFILAVDDSSDLDASKSDEKKSENAPDANTTDSTEPKVDTSNDSNNQKSSTTNNTHSEPETKKSKSAKKKERKAKEKENSESPKDNKENSPIIMPYEPSPPDTPSSGTNSRRSSRSASISEEVPKQAEDKVEKLGSSGEVSKVCSTCGNSVGKLRICSGCQKVYLFLVSRLAVSFRNPPPPPLHLFDCGDITAVRNVKQKIGEYTRLHAKKCH